MEIRSALLKEHSKRQTLKIAGYVSGDKKRFAELVKLFLQDEYRIAQRASWVLSACSEKNPQLILPYLEKLIDNLKRPVHDAVKRNTVRILQFVDIPHRLLGETADACFRLLANREEAVAIRVFSMTVLYNICRREPELGRELKLLIEEEMPYAKPAFASRGRKVLRQL